MRLQIFELPRSYQWRVNYASHITRSRECQVHLGTSLFLKLAPPFPNSKAEDTPPHSLNISLITNRQHQSFSQTSSIVPTVVFSRAVLETYTTFPAKQTSD